MATRKSSTGIVIVIATIGLIFSLSSCAPTTKTGSTGEYQGKEYLEDMGNGVCQQHPTGLMWQAGKSDNFTSWEEADQYVKTLNLGGYGDWRLPTPDECLRVSKLIQAKKSNCPMETGGNHWVSKSENIEAGQWESNVYCDGPIFRWTKEKKGTVKAVRP